MNQLAFIEQKPVQIDGRKRTALMFVVAKPDRFRDDFAEWLDANWHIWLAFDREACRIYRKGREHYGARTIIEWMRHESSVRESGSEFKLNNNFAPDLARLWECHHPEAAGFFERRVGQSARRAA